MALDDDFAAESALPAQRHGVWDAGGGCGCVVLGIVAAGHCVCFLAFAACGCLSKVDRGGCVLLGGGVRGDWVLDRIVGSWVWVWICVGAYPSAV